MIKKISIAVLVALVLGAVVAAVLPRTWHVERSVVVEAPPARVFPLLVDLKRWQDWSVWTRELDPALRNIYEGPADGVGARWSWLGPKMGRGSIEIVAADVATGIELDQRLEGDEVNSRARLTLTAEGTGTRITWVDEGTLPPMAGLYRSTVEVELGAHLEKSLKRLKTLLEAAPPSGS